MASTKREQATKAAGILLAYIGNLDPTWKERIQITQDEFHYDDLQTAGLYIANQLEAGLHTVIPRHPFFEPGVELPEGPAHCKHCEKVFEPEYAGQPLCSNECAQLYYVYAKAGA